MLNDVTFLPRHGRGGVQCEFDSMAKLVARFLASTDWSRVFGMSYRDTMRLTYAEWTSMQSILNTRPKPSLPPDLENL